MQIGKSVNAVVILGKATNVIVDDLGKGSETVGSARSVGHDFVFRLVGIKVDTTDKPNDVISHHVINLSGSKRDVHRSISGGSGNDDLLGTSLEMDTGLFGSGEDTSRLNDVFGTSLTPFNVGRVLLTENGNRLVVDIELTVLNLDRTLEATMCLLGMRLKCHTER